MEWRSDQSLTSSSQGHSSSDKKPSLDKSIQSSRDMIAVSEIAFGLQEMILQKPKSQPE
jgi:hypothetical protein